MALSTVGKGKADGFFVSFGLAKPEFVGKKTNYEINFPNHSSSLSLVSGIRRLVCIWPAERQRRSEFASAQVADEYSATP